MKFKVNGKKYVWRPAVLAENLIGLALTAAVAWGLILTFALAEFWR